MYLRERDKRNETVFEHFLMTQSFKEIMVRFMWGNIWNSFKLRCVAQFHILYHNIFLMVSVVGGRKLQPSELYEDTFDHQVTTLIPREAEYVMQCDTMPVHFNC